MSDNKEPKVTECWTDEKPLDREYPSAAMVSYATFKQNYRPAILMWREDYDAMRKELENVKMKLEQAEFLANSTLEENRKLWKELGASTWKEIVEAHDDEEAK